MPTVAVRGGRLFEFQHVSTKNKLLIYKDILDDRHDLSRERLILSFQIQHRHGEARWRCGGVRVL
jgi:hypothetical protein